MLLPKYKVVSVIRQWAFSQVNFILKCKPFHINKTKSFSVQIQVKSLVHFCTKLTTKPWSFIFRIMFWPITAKPISAISALQVETIFCQILLTLFTTITKNKTKQKTPTFIPMHQLFIYVYSIRETRDSLVCKGQLQVMSTSDLSILRLSVLNVLTSKID